MAALVLALEVSACGTTVTGQAQPTVGIADPKLDTTTPQLPAVGDCAKIHEFVQHGLITVMDCADPAATSQVKVIEIVSGDEGKTVTCMDNETLLIITGLKDGSLGVAHGCAGPNLTAGRCYVPRLAINIYDASCTDPDSFRLDRTLSGISDVAVCDPPIADDDYAGKIEYIRVKSKNFIDKRTGVAYCFREK
ncbi:hypothetical protein ACFWU5_10485 [Nocardia sp. NPDC058640]|uniref:hypothetical protein n=1 Tax=Nocardia sp. NPDC058640 TaxID=3346571 RepID=UPI0036657BF6